jgi:GH24 family phage-related lysozyme (muramidase)
MSVKQRIAVAALTLSAAGFGAWKTHESYVAAPMIPTQGDVPTIGYGSTHYEDGRPVRMSDAPISRQRAEVLARNLLSLDEMRFRASLPGVTLTQGEYDLYMDFVGQYGLGNWRSSSMRRLLLQGEYRMACDALLAWRKQAGRDCSLPANWGPHGCKGVWTRQQARHAKCLAEQGA